MIVCVADVAVDARGQATLRTGSRFEQAALRVSAPGYLPEVVELMAPPATELVVRLARATSVRGVVRPAPVLSAWGPTDAEVEHAAHFVEHQARLPRLQLQLQPSSGRAVTTDLDATGAYAFEHLAAGEWTPFLQVRVPTGTSSDKVLLALGPPFRVVDGAARELSFSASALSSRRAAVHAFLHEPQLSLHQLSA